MRIHLITVKIKSGNNIELFAPFGSRIVCGDDPRLQRGKPNPDIFLLAAREGLGMHEGVREIGPDADGTSAGAEDSFLVFEDAKVSKVVTERKRRNVLKIDHFVLSY